MASASFQSLWQPQTYPKWVSVDLEVWQLGHFDGGRYHIAMPYPELIFILSSGTSLPFSLVNIYASCFNAKKHFSAGPRLSHRTSVWYKPSPYPASIPDKNRWKMVMIKSIRSNKAHNWHHNFTQRSESRSFSTKWLSEGDEMKRRSTFDMGFCLYTCCLILPIKPVFIPDIFGAPSVVTPILSKAAQVHTHAQTSPVAVPCRLSWLARSSNTSKAAIISLMKINNWAVSCESLLSSSTGQNTSNSCSLFHGWLIR